MATHHCVVLSRRLSETFRARSYVRNAPPPAASSLNSSMIVTYDSFFDAQMKKLHLFNMPEVCLGEPIVIGRSAFSGLQSGLHICSSGQYPGGRASKVVSTISMSNGCSLMLDFSKKTKVFIASD